MSTTISIIEEATHLILQEKKVKRLEKKVRKLQNQLGLKHGKKVVNAPVAEKVHILEKKVKKLEKRVSLKHGKKAVNATVEKKVKILKKKVKKIEKKAIELDLASDVVVVYETSASSTDSGVVPKAHAVQKVGAVKSVEKLMWKTKKDQTSKNIW